MTKDKTLDVYWTIGLWTVGISAVVLALSPFIKRLMHLDTLRDDDEIRADEGLAGYKEVAEPAAPGMFPQRETKPGPDASTP